MIITDKKLTKTQQNHIGAAVTAHNFGRVSNTGGIQIGQSLIVFEKNAKAGTLTQRKAAPPVRFAYGDRAMDTFIDCFASDSGEQQFNLWVYT